MCIQGFEPSTWELSLVDVHADSRKLTECFFTTKIICNSEI